MRSILTINAGSSNLKLAVFDATTLARIHSLQVELSGPDDHAIERVLRSLGALDWWAVGHRVTQGGDATGPRVIDVAVRAELLALAPVAPHQLANLAGINAAQRVAPGALQVACFDTSFHRSIPDMARRYALPRALFDAGIAVSGYHGLSYEYIASVLPEHLGARANGRVIVAHLGSGASMCAMRDRVSIATTMGLTPLDGLPMATRCGALDPGVVLYLLEARGMAPAEVRELLYERSGLLGVSGESGSMKALLASASTAAAEAVELFVYRAACAIGGLAGALGGLDALVFTGGIGEHSDVIRDRITDRIAWLHPEVAIIPTDEELVIARHVVADFGVSAA